MEALLELDQLEEAKTLASRCRRALRSAEHPFDQSLLLNALAKFFARTREWGRAIESWQNAPLDSVFGRDALRGIVQIYLAFAFERTEWGLGLLAQLKQHHEHELDLRLPGNDLKLTLDAEKELLKLKCGIKRLLPEKARKQLGISNRQIENEYR